MIFEKFSVNMRMIKYGPDDKFNADILTGISKVILFIWREIHHDLNGEFDKCIFSRDLQISCDRPLTDIHYNPALLV